MLRFASLLALALAANAQVYHHGLYPLVPHFEGREAAPKPCPQAPARPEGVDGCNWIPIQDTRGCILDYECEPKGPEPCPAPPMMPEDSTRCKWTAIKNAKGCIIDFECEPRKPLPLPAFAHHAPVFHHAPAPVPVAHPYPIYFPAAHSLGGAPQKGSAAMTLTNTGPAAAGAQAGAAGISAMATQKLHSFGHFDYGFWQRYFQQMLARGASLGQQGQQGFQGYGQAYGQGGAPQMPGQTAQGQGQEYMWVYPQGQGQQGQGQQTSLTTNSQIPTGQATATVAKGKGQATPLTTAFGGRSAGAPRKLKKL